MKWRVSVPRNSGKLFILSASARAHARTAMRRQRRIVAIDGFLDLDLDADEAIRTILENGQFSFEVLEIVSKRSQPGDVLAYGSGFEAHPELLERSQAYVRVLGNTPDTVRLCADPVRLSERSARLGLPFPETRSQPPDCLKGWLVKRKGRSGGNHVRPASRETDDSDSLYWQRQCAGEPHSALFLAGGREARVVGISQLLTSGKVGAPYAWSGAIGPVKVWPEIFEQVQWAAQVLTRDLDLLGLCGIDFIFDSRKELQIVDLNPRLVATCELYMDHFTSDYMSAHVETCLTGRPDGRLIPSSRRRGGARGMRVVYAPCRMLGGENWKWPKEAADLPASGTSIDAGQPLCTVRGHYHNADEAHTSLQNLHDQVLQNLRAELLHPFSPGNLDYEITHQH